MKIKLQSQSQFSKCVCFMNLKMLRDQLVQSQVKQQQNYLDGHIKNYILPPNHLIYNRQHFQGSQIRKINQFSQINNHTNLFLMMQNNKNSKKQQQFLFKQQKISELLNKEIKQLKQACIYCKITEDNVQRTYQFEIFSQTLNIKGKQKQFRSQNFRQQLLTNKRQLYQLFSIDQISQTYACILYYETLFINCDSQKQLQVKKIQKLTLIIKLLQANKKKYRLIYKIDKQNSLKQSHKSFSKRQYQFEIKNNSYKQNYYQRRIIISKKVYLLQNYKEQNLEKGAFGLVRRADCFELAMTQSNQTQDCKTIEVYFKKNRVAIKRLHQDSDALSKRGYKISQKRQGIILNLITLIKRKEKINDLRRECGLPFKSKLIGIQNIISMVQCFQLTERDKPYIYIVFNLYNKSLTEISRIKNRRKAFPENQSVKNVESQTQNFFEQYFSRDKYFSHQLFKIIEKLVSALYCLHYELGIKYQQEIKQYFQIQIESKDYQSIKQQKETASFGIYHRDIKPPNILIDKLKSRQMIKFKTNPLINCFKEKQQLQSQRQKQYQQMWEQAEVLLIDMGMCKIGDVTNPKNLTLCGSHYYMAPQMRQYHPYNAKVDIWSLGIILFELISRNKKKFYPQSQSYRMAQVADKVLKQIATLKQLTSENLLKQKWFTLLEKMLAKDPSKRASSKQVLEFLKINQLELKDIQIEKEILNKGYVHLFKTDQCSKLEHKIEDKDAKSTRIQKQKGWYSEYFIGNLESYQIFPQRYQIIYAIQYYFRVKQNLKQSFETSIISYRYTPKNKPSLLYIEINIVQSIIKNRRNNIEIVQKIDQSGQKHKITFKDQFLRKYDELQTFFVGFYMEPNRTIFKKVLFKENGQIQSQEQEIQKILPRNKFKNIIKLCNPAKIQSQFIDQIIKQLSNQNPIEFLIDKQQIQLSNYLAIRKEKDHRSTKIYFSSKSILYHLSRQELKSSSLNLKSIFIKIYNILNHKNCQISSSAYVNILNVFIKLNNSNQQIQDDEQKITKNFINFRHNIEYLVAIICKQKELSRMGYCWISIINEYKQVFFKILGPELDRILKDFNANEQNRSKPQGTIFTLEYLHNTTDISYEVTKSKELLDEFNCHIKRFVLNDYLQKF